MNRPFQESDSLSIPGRSQPALAVKVHRMSVLGFLSHFSTFLQGLNSAIVKQKYSHTVTHNQMCVTRFQECLIHKNRGWAGFGSRAIVGHLVIDNNHKWCLSSGNCKMLPMVLARLMPTHTIFSTLTIDP